jgi:ankyrin repeat protein
MKQVLDLKVTRIAENKDSSKIANKFNIVHPKRTFVVGVSEAIHAQAWKKAVTAAIERAVGNSAQSPSTVAAAEAAAVTNTNRVEVSNESTTTPVLRHITSESVMSQEDEPPKRASPTPQTTHPERKQYHASASSSPTPMQQHENHQAGLYVEDEYHRVGWRYEVDDGSFHAAAFHGDYDRISSSLAHGKDVNACDPDGYTALHLTSYAGHMKIVCLLLEHGGKLLRTKLTQSPLHLAARSAHVRIIRVLLKHGNSPDGLDLEFRTPLWEVCHAPAQRLTAVVEHESDSDYGETPIEEAVRVLVRAGADVERTYEGLPLIHVLAQRNFAHSVAALLDNGASLHSICDQARTALHYAAQYGSVDVIELLLRRGSQPNVRDIMGNTALHMARTIEVASQLVRHGARMDLENNAKQQADAHPFIRDHDAVCCSCNCLGGLMFCCMCIYVLILCLVVLFPCVKQTPKNIVRAEYLCRGPSKYSI